MQLHRGMLWKCPALAYFAELEAKLNLHDLPQWQLFRDYKAIGLDGTFVVGLTTFQDHAEDRGETAIEKLKLIEFRRRIIAGSFPRFGGLREAVAGLQFIQADPIDHRRGLRI